MRLLPLVFAALVAHAEPVLRFSRSVGDPREWSPSAIAIDPAGNAYVTGAATLHNRDTNVFVAKLGQDGATLYSVVFGGSQWEIVRAIAVDATGSAYVTGTTGSTDFPTVNAFQSERGGSWAAFVVKLDPSGRLVYSTYLRGVREALAITADRAGSAYVTGSSASSELPVTPGALRPNGTTGAFITKFNPDGRTLAFSTWLGGANMRCASGPCAGVIVSSVPFSPTIFAYPVAEGRAIAVDGAGNVYVGGATNVVDFPVTRGALQTECRCYVTWGNGFVVKLDAAGSRLLYASYLGGPQPFDRGYSDRLAGDSVDALAIGSVGDIYVGGATNSTGSRQPAARCKQRCAARKQAVTDLSPG